MPLTSSIQDFYIKKFVGMNNKIEDNELSVEHSILTQNARFENEPGSLIKRVPISYYNPTTMGAGSVHSIYRWRRGDGESVLVAVSGASMYVGNDTTGVMTAIRSGLTEDRKMAFAVYKNLLICSNGYDDMFLYDGSDAITWELGSCKAEGTVTAGNPNGIYYYAVTFDNDAIVSGAVSNTVNVSSKQISLTNIPIGPAGTANRKIYRTVASGATLKLLTTIADNTTTTYTDDTADGGLGADMPAVTDAMPKGSLLNLHRERLFVSGDPSNPNRIYYSYPYLPWMILQNTDISYLEVFVDEGDEIQGIPIVQDVMLCIKRNTIRRIYVQQATSGASPESWYASDIISYQGSPARYSIIETIYGVVYLGWDHWYIFDGSNSKEIIDEFDTDEIFSSDYRNVVCHFRDGILYGAYTRASTGSQFKDALMVYNFRRNALDIDNVRVESFTSYAGGDDVNEFFYGSSEQGYVYYAEQAEKVIRYRKMSDFDLASFDDASVAGEEDDPYLFITWDLTIDELDQTVHPEAFNAANSQIDSLKGTIDMMDTTGTVVLPSINLNVKTFGRLYWNLDKFHDSDTATFYVRSGATQALCEAAAWGSGYTDSNGSNISTTPNQWIQIKVDMVANSTAGSPRIYYVDGFVIKLTYTQGGTDAETAVEFIHEVGYRNFNLPMVDKIFKKILTNHEGEEGSFNVDWWTENSSGSFTVDLNSHPSSWDSFFPSTAFGKKLNLRIYKNDLNDFKIKEIQGLYTPEPVIV